MPNYRTSVLKDFSSVRKAFFQVYKDKGFQANGENMLNRRFKFQKQFPVQINPNSLNLDYYGKDKQGDRAHSANNQGLDAITNANSNTRFKPYWDRSPDESSVRIKLTYDIYDEYNVRTMNGAIPENAFSLHNDGNEITSLEELRKYAGNYKYRVMFIWGEIHIFGFLDKLDVTYDVFSRWGEPLKADVSLDIDRQALGYDKEDGTELDPLDGRCLPVLGKGRAKAETYRKHYDRAMRAQLLASSALR